MQICICRVKDGWKLKGTFCIGVCWLFACVVYLLLWLCVGSVWCYFTHLPFIALLMFNRV